MGTRSNRQSCFPVALVLFLDACFLIGTVKAMGVLLKDISRSLDTTATDIGAALGLFTAFNFASSPLIVAIYRRVSHPRMLILIGAILSSVGIILLSFATHNIMLFIFLSAAGIGHAIQGICSVIVLDEIAGERFNLYYSFAMCGFSAAMVLFPLMADSLLAAYDWRGAVLIMGSVMLNMIPAVMNIHMPPTGRLSVDDADSNPSAPFNIDMTIDEGIEGEKDIENALDTDDSPLVSSSKEQDWSSPTLDEYNSRLNRENNMMEKVLQWFRQTDFYLDPFFNFIVLSYGFHEFVYSGWHAFLVPHCLQRGISINRTIIMTLSAAIGNLAGRILVAFLTHGIMDPTNMYLAVTILDMTALACDAFIPNFYVMLVTSCCSAGAIAGRAVLGPIVLRERTSHGNFPVAICAFNFIAGCFSLLGGSAAGLIADTFSTFDATFKLLAVMDVLVFISMLPPRVMKKHESTN